MDLHKRQFLKASSLTLASLSLSPVVGAASSTATDSVALTNLTSKVKPISVDERKARIKKAQKLMAEQNIAAIVLEPGAAMDYFTGIQWWRSERLTAVVIPREGDIAVLCPFFEEPSIRESLAVGKDVRVWQEHESPFALVKQILVDRNVAKDGAKLAFENTVRYFVLKGVMDLLPTMVDVRAEPITLGCRMFKSEHEIELMRKANEITLKAYAHVWSKLQLGMDQNEVKSLMASAQSQLGGSGVWNMALFNEASAYPHGTNQAQTIREGSIVLMDCGCEVQGYQSDISRTFVFGEPTKKQQKIWHNVREGQRIAFETAQLGVAAGVVDDKVRAFYQEQGFGPDYKLPGLSHRTGHGIGMEGHESVNFVHGETTVLKPGMCFSNEPGIYLPGEFGVRLEDCIYMTEQGPKWFTVPPNSLADPIGTMGS
ncbi:M24 family metallopeptidase [Paraglaciecola hydrolytica]|uniref:Peptidase n=1 Tax=Paraglaciecola hydrolytica TaxID=1799789 RepID=A0A148KMB6_9ALTE|nr:Xaa-Pro peptidase family protein [Paraglaciecola hydrolytica]KXI27430.1 peptidase [Paraglaciecola hydrolytica]